MTMFNPDTELLLKTSYTKARGGWRPVLRRDGKPFFYGLAVCLNRDCDSYSRGLAARTVAARLASEVFGCKSPGQLYDEKNSAYLSRVRAH